MRWKPIFEWTDLPEHAGIEVDLTVENRFGQIFVTTAFQGYGDFKWHTYNCAFMEDWKSGDNRLSHNWRPLAWRHRPEPYNPYLIDARYLIKDLNELVKTERSTIEIKGKLIPLVEDHLLYNEAPGHFYKQWREEADSALKGDTKNAD